MVLYRYLVDKITQRFKIHSYFQYFITTFTLHIFLKPWQRCKGACRNTFFAYLHTKRRRDNMTENFASFVIHGCQTRSAPIAQIFGYHYTVLTSKKSLSNRERQKCAVEY